VDAARFTLWGKNNGKSALRKRITLHRTAWSCPTHGPLSDSTSSPAGCARRQDGPSPQTSPEARARVRLAATEDKVHTATCSERRQGAPLLADIAVSRLGPAATMHKSAAADMSALTANIEDGADTLLSSIRRPWLLLSGVTVAVVVLFAGGGPLSAAMHASRHSPPPPPPPPPHPPPPPRLFPPPPPSPSACGDGRCEPPETMVDCPADCPGVTTPAQCGEEPHSDPAGEAVAWGSAPEHPNSSPNPSPNPNPDPDPNPGPNQERRSPGAQRPSTASRAPGDPNPNPRPTSTLTLTLALRAP